MQTTPVPAVSEHLINVFNMTNSSDSIKKTDLENNKYLHRKLFGNTEGDIPDYMNDHKAIEGAIQIIENRGFGQVYREILYKEILKNENHKISSPSPADKTIALVRFLRITGFERSWGVMKCWIKYIYSVRIELNILLVSCLVILILVEFVLSDIPELFDGSAKIGIFIDKLCLSYVSSYIFYFMVIHLKNQKDKENLSEYISKKTYEITKDAKRVLEYYQKTLGFKLQEKYPQQEEVQKICQFLKESKAPLGTIQSGIFYHNGSWIQYFDSYRKQIKDSISKLYIKMPFLESEHLKLIVNIEDCDFFKLIGSLAEVQLDLDWDWLKSAEHIYDYFNKVKLLENYADHKLKGYIMSDSGDFFDNQGRKYYYLKTEISELECCINIFLIRNKRKMVVGRAYCILNSSDDLKLADIIIYNDLNFSSPQDKLFKLTHWFEPTDYQRKGLGSYLLKSIINLAKNKGIKKIHGSFTEQDIEANPNLIKWYQKYGFKLEAPTSEEVETAKYRICLYLD